MFHILKAVCSDASFSTPILDPETRWVLTIHRSMTPIPQSMKANIWKNIKDIFSGTNHRKSVHKEILFLKTCETLQQPWYQCGQVPEDDVYDKLWKAFPQLSQLAKAKKEWITWISLQSIQIQIYPELRIWCVYVCIYI